MDLARQPRLGGAALVGVAVIAGLSGGAARAAPATSRLDYRVASGCPAAGDFAAVVAARLGYDPFRTDAPQRVIVRIDPTGRALEGRLEWRDAAGGWIGEQTLPSRTGNCAELVRAMGFALAVQFQLMATLAAEPRAQPPLPAQQAATPSPPLPAPTRPAPAAPAPAPTATNASAAPAVAAVSTTAARPPETVSRQDDATSAGARLSGPAITVGAGLAVALGAAPSPTAVGRLLGTAAWSHTALELGGELSLPSTTKGGDGTGFSQQEALGSLAGCGVVRPWGACLVAKVGELRVTGQGVDVPATAVGLMVQTGGRLTWTHTLGGRFEVIGRAEGLVLLTAGRVILDSRTIWTTPRFTALLGVDVGVRFR